MPAPGAPAATRRGAPRVRPGRGAELRGRGPIPLRPRGPLTQADDSELRPGARGEDLEEETPLQPPHRQIFERDIFEAKAGQDYKYAAWHPHPHVSKSPFERSLTFNYFCASSLFPANLNLLPPDLSKIHLCLKMQLTCCLLHQGFPNPTS